MITFDSDIFLFNDIIYVNDPSEYIYLDSLMNDKPEETTPDEDEKNDDSDIKFAKKDKLNDENINDNIEGNINEGINVDDVIDDENINKNTNDNTSSDNTSTGNIHPSHIDTKPIKFIHTITNQNELLKLQPIWELNKQQSSDILSEYDHYKNARFAIKFSKKIPSNISDNHSLFKTQSADDKYLKSITISQLTIPAKDDNPSRKIPLLIYNNMCLPSSTSIDELRYIIAYLLNINKNNVIVRIRDKQTVLFPQSDLVMSSNTRWVHLIETVDKLHSDSFDDVNTIHEINDLTNQTISIGDNSIIITIKKTNDSRNNIYTELFYSNYYITLMHIKNIMNNNEKYHLTSCPFALNISNISLRLLYKGPKDSYSQANIIKLFNINHISSKCSKMYIQSKLLDSLEGNSRDYMYVKSYIDSTNVFKDIDALYNTCSFYYADALADDGSKLIKTIDGEAVDGKINSGVLLHHIDVDAKLTLTFSFTNTNSKLSFDQLIDLCTKFIIQNAEIYIKEMQLYECVYNLLFDMSYYVIVFNDINASFVIHGVNPKDVNGPITELLLENIPQKKFDTKTSLMFTSYNFYSVCYWYNMMYLKNAHEFITTNIINKDIAPTTHIIVNDNDMTVTLDKIPSFKNLIFAASMIIGSLSKIESIELLNEMGSDLYELSSDLSEMDDNNDNTNDNTSDDTSKKTKKKKKSKTKIKSSDIIDAINKKLDINGIRASAMKHNKQLLKTLTKIDPVLFGPRIIGKKSRSYSGLCQKKEQRPVPITEIEYDALMNYHDDTIKQSIAKLQNQTYPNQKLCLFCPDKEYYFMNYHYFPNQKCIVRCTAKTSNKTQYDFCTKALGTEHPITISNKYENQTVTLYNALISDGRKCKLPEELRTLLPNYILLKIIPEFDNITQIVMERYGKQPFIIRREIVPKGDIFICTHYSVLSEYNSEYEYILTLQSESDRGYFILVTEGAKPQPFILSEHPEIRDFIVSHIRVNNDNNNFIRYIENVLNINFTDLADKPLSYILEFLTDNYKVKYVIHREKNIVYGILVDKTYYMTPLFYWRTTIQEMIMHTIDIETVAEGIRKKEYDLPNITTLDHAKIKTIYIDYTTKLPRMIDYGGTKIFISPFELTAKYANIDRLLFDYYSCLREYENMSKPKYDAASMGKSNKSYDVSIIINTYIYIYLMTNPYISVGDFRKFLTNIGVLIERSQTTKYCDPDTKKHISWRNSKIAQSEFDSFIRKYGNFEKNNIISRRKLC